VKAFVSSTRDRFRAPYEREVEDHPRQCVFIATTNAIEYLKDWTGNTRFWPLRCTKIDLEGFALARDQLLAEAVAVYRAGGDSARAHPDAEEEARLFEPERAIRVSVHPWFDITAKYLRDNPEIISVTVNEMLEKCFGMSAAEMGRDAQAEQRVGKALQKLGWEKRRDGKADPDGIRARRWHRPVAKPALGAEDDVEVPF
jgi:putative DNA primase/helicase